MDDEVDLEDVEGSTDVPPAREVEYEEVARLKLPIALTNMAALETFLAAEYGPELWLHSDEPNGWLIVTRQRVR